MHNSHLGHSSKRIDLERHEPLHLLLEIYRLHQAPVPSEPNVTQFSFESLNETRFFFHNSNFVRQDPGFDWANRANQTTMKSSSVSTITSQYSRQRVVLMLKQRDSYRSCPTNVRWSSDLFCWFPAKESMVEVPSFSLLTSPARHFVFKFFRNIEFCSCLPFFRSKIRNLPTFRSETHFSMSPRPSNLACWIIWLGERSTSTLYAGLRHQ